MITNLKLWSTEETTSVSNMMVGTGLGPHDLPLLSFLSSTEPTSKESATQTEIDQNVPFLYFTRTLPLTQPVSSITTVIQSPHSCRTVVVLFSSGKVIANA